MKQPDALRLASALNSESERVSAGVKYSTARQSAKELVRLHEANQAMLEALLECVEDSEQAVTDYVLMYGEKHRPQRLYAMRETVRKARAAIAKATGEES